MKWISVKDELPPMDEEVAVKYVHESGAEEIHYGGFAYMESTHCILASVSSFGNFGEGWGTQNARCENGLTVDAPDLWQGS